LLSLSFADRHHTALLSLQRLRDRLRQKFHERDVRLQSSVSLLAVLLCAALSFALAPRLPSANGAVLSPQAEAARATEALRSTQVKMLDGKPRSELCEEQTWPYIDRRCLRIASNPTTAGAGSNPPVQTESVSTAAAPSAPRNEPPASASDGARDVPLPPPRSAAEASPEPQRELSGDPWRYPPLYAARPDEPGLHVVAPPYWMMDRPYDMRRWSYEEPRMRSYRRARRGNGVHIGGLFFRF